MTTTYSRYPARVSGSDGLTVNRAAVLVHADGSAVVAVLSGGRSGDVQIVGQLEQVTVKKNPNRTATLTAEDGTTWTVSRGDGCGCTSALSRWLNREQGTPRRVGT